MVRKLPVALKGLSIRADQELLKVPGNIVPAHWTPDDGLWISHESQCIITGKWQAVFQVDKQGVCILSIHIHLLKELELWFKAIPWTDILQTFEDFIVLAVLLL